MTTTAVSRPETAHAEQNPVSFDLFEQCPGWGMAPDWVSGLIERYKCRRILEIGSGANPTLPSNVIADTNLYYVANDADPEELNKADPAFRRWVGDVSDGVPEEMAGNFDLVFSRMVNEHIEDGRNYHANIHRLLAPGGISAHCFSTLYSLPFVTNRLLPERIGDSILHMFDPRDRVKRGKFRAYYSWSRGPSRRMISRFESLGFEVVNYVGYFGHGYYWRWPIIHRLELIKSRALVARPIPALCSFAMLIARKK
jgi:SAM-dependent methyltransferase